MHLSQSPAFYNGLNDSWYCSIIMYTMRENISESKTAVTREKMLKRVNECALAVILEGLIF